jgi:hypothetical protein
LFIFILFSIFKLMDETSSVVEDSPNQSDMERDSIKNEDEKSPVNEKNEEELFDPELDLSEEMEDQVNLLIIFSYFFFFCLF